MNKHLLRIIAILILSVTLQGVAAAEPLPALVVPQVSSGYGQFLQTLNEIGKAKPPVADDFTDMTGGVLAVAQGLLGRPTLWGGTSPITGFDCSGFTQYVFRKVGIELPRTADLQFLVGRPVPRTALRPGDLIYFTTYEPGASHVGIYIGRDKFIHTSYVKGVVAVGDMNDEYFAQRYYGARRMG